MSAESLLAANGYRVRSFDSAISFLKACDGSECGVVISDLCMPMMDGLELQRELADRSLPLPVILVSGCADVPTAVRALQTGAIMLLEKPYDKTALFSAISEASQLAQRWFELKRQSRDAHQRLARLKAGERGVMDMILAGHANKTIAARLDISLRTVERCRHEILDKLGTESVVELAGLVKAAQRDKWRFHGLAVFSSLAEDHALS